MCTRGHCGCACSAHHSRAAHSSHVQIRQCRCVCSPMYRCVLISPKQQNSNPTMLRRGRVCCSSVLIMTRAAVHRPLVTTMIWQSPAPTSCFLGKKFVFVLSCLAFVTSCTYVKHYNTTLRIFLNVSSPVVKRAQRSLMVSNDPSPLSMKKNAPR